MAEITSELRRNLERAAEFILSSRHLVALTGAGLSVESGIPPYRGPGGLWTKHGEPAMLSFRTFVQDPKSWWEQRLLGELDQGNPIREMKLAVDRAAPNTGHYSLDKTVLTPWCDLAVRGPSGEVLPMLLERVRRVLASG